MIFFFNIDSTSKLWVVGEFVARSQLWCLTPINPDQK